MYHDTYEVKIEKRWVYMAALLVTVYLGAIFAAVIWVGNRLASNPTKSVAVATGSYVAPTAEPTLAPALAPEKLDVSFACDEVQDKCTVWIEGGNEEWLRYRLEVPKEGVPTNLGSAQLHLQLDLVEVDEEHVRYEKTVGGIPIFVEGEFRPQADYAPQILVTVGAGDWLTGTVITLNKNIE